MKIEQVNERISALESAGELSIKEQFYLEALRELVMLAAMGSEPVAWRWRSGPDARWRLASRGDISGEVEPLYRYAPVAPDDYQHLKNVQDLYHAQEKRLFKIAQCIKGPAFDKYSHSPSQAIDVLEGAIFGENDDCRAAMLSAAPQEVPNGK